MMHVFSIYDTKAEAYNLPFFKKTLGLAVRDFEEASNDPDSPFAKHAADFVLFYIADFDEQKGVFHNVTAQNMGTALSYRKSVQEALPLRKSG